MNQPINQRYATYATYITASLSLAPLSVAAQDAPGFYASVYGGVTAAPSTSLSETRATGPAVGGQGRLWSSVEGSSWQRPIASARRLRTSKKISV